MLCLLQLYKFIEQFCTLLHSCIWSCCDASWQKSTNWSSCRSTWCLYLVTVVFKCIRTGLLWYLSTAFKYSCVPACRWCFLLCNCFWISTGWLHPGMGHSAFSCGIDCHPSTLSPFCNVGFEEDRPWILCCGHKYECRLCDNCHIELEFSYILWKRNITWNYFEI